MSSVDHSYFGTDSQKAVLRRGRALYEVTRNDHRFAYYGRSVGLADAPGGDYSLLVSLVRLQGNSNIGNIPDSDLPQARNTLESFGLSVTHYARWVGGKDALEAARRTVESSALPSDLTVVPITTETPPALLCSFAETLLGCGVLPPATEVLTGQLRPGLAMAAVDNAGRVMSCAGAASCLHPAHPMGREETWWGMLATHPDRRGERLSLILGAHALIGMHERYGFTRFVTGVEPGNAPSEAVCTRMGLRRRGASIVTVADPSLLPGGRMTK